jgi:hypothetical protein
LRITLATKTRTSLVKGLLQEKTYVSVGSGFNFSHSNCQGSPLEVHPGGVRGADRRLSPHQRTVKRFLALQARCVTDKKKLGFSKLEKHV